MKQPSLIIYLSIPAVFTLGVFAVAGRREPFGVEMFSAYVIESYLFYAAPYLVWTVVATLAKASRPVWQRVSLLRLLRSWQSLACGLVRRTPLACHCSGCSIGRWQLCFSWP